MAELSTSDIVGRVRVAIQQLLPAAEVTEEKVADIVATNVRTLHRRLSEHGLSFRALLKEMRMKLARRYMADDGYSITDVAFMLGYSDVSAFSRAFRSWFDMTPSQFRASES
jgi:AraC-like DNA-binding protein